jgi:mRNA-degrading endonuclease RelE of RelBE toxin-antitoxin system
MPSVHFSPEGVHSFSMLPPGVLEKFNAAFSILVRLGPRTTRLDPHPLSGGRGLWTLRIGPYRGIYHWDGDEARFIRFGHRRSVYARLPK